MTYAISDIHGEYGKYIAMLDLIGFSEDDTLYVLGDVLDRGDSPVRILQDMAARDNVYPILGNHEAVAQHLLPQLLVEITEENFETHMDPQLMSQLLDWQMDGGAATLKDFQKLGAEERYDLLDYISEFQLYETVDVGERTFVLVHAGLQNFQKGRALSSYSPAELLLGHHDFSRRYYDDPSIYVVTGHTPTQSITGKAEIYRENNSICIDCGATFPGGRLACLCLDTMQEFYVD